MRSAGIILRANADRDADGIFYEDYHLNNFDLTTLKEHQNSTDSKFAHPGSLPLKRARESDQKGKLFAVVM